MNPFESLIIVLSCLIIVSMVSLFFSDFSIIISGSSDELDLINVVNVYNAGRNFNAFFNTTYSPFRNGTLVITQDFIFFNNASMKNPGFENVNCNYELIFISEEGINCV